MNEIEVKMGERKEAKKLKLMQFDDIIKSSNICWPEKKDLKHLQSILLDENNEEN